MKVPLTRWAFEVILSSREDVAFSFLFGSYADGTATSLSDVDVEEVKARLVRGGVALPATSFPYLKPATLKLTKMSIHVLKEMNDGTS